MNKKILLLFAIAFVLSAVATVVYAGGLNCNGEGCRAVSVVPTTKNVTRFSTNTSQTFTTNFITWTAFCGNGTANVTCLNSTAIDVTTVCNDTVDLFCDGKTYEFMFQQINGTNVSNVTRVEVANGSAVFVAPSAGGRLTVGVAYENQPVKGAVLVPRLAGLAIQDFEIVTLTGKRALVLLGLDDVASIPPFQHIPTALMIDTDSANPRIIMSQKGWKLSPPAAAPQPTITINVAVDDDDIGKILIGEVGGSNAYDLVFDASTNIPVLEFARGKEYNQPGPPATVSIKDVEVTSNGDFAVFGDYNSGAGLAGGFFQRQAAGQEAAAGETASITEGLVLWSSAPVFGSENEGAAGARISTTNLVAAIAANANLGTMSWGGEASQIPFQTAEVFAGSSAPDYYDWKTIARGTGPDEGDVLICAWQYTLQNIRQCFIDPQGVVLDIVDVEWSNPTIVVAELNGSYMNGSRIYVINKNDVVSAFDVINMSIDSVALSAYKNTGGHAGDYVEFVTGGVMMGDSKDDWIIIDWFNTDLGLDAENPNGTMRFTTDKTVRIQTFAPDINILNFQLDFQNFNGTFDTTLGTCTNCSFDGSNIGWCQAEVEKVWGMFESYNLTINLSTNDVLNMTELLMVCRSFNETVQLNSNCSGLSPYVDTATGCFTPGPATAGYSRVVGNALEIDLINMSNSSIDIRLGKLQPDATCEQIACEITGTWSIGDPTQNFVVNKSITATAN
ncbi:hypothetical protein KY346_04565 [Candidatus Woesearchaeota archaeon]|nr:hypothetical protein [Candidatus Woesearchaeota archaeon]